MPLALLVVLGSTIEGEHNVRELIVSIGRIVCGYARSLE